MVLVKVHNTTEYMVDRGAEVQVTVSCKGLADPRDAANGTAAEGEGKLHTSFSCAVR